MAENTDNSVKEIIRSNRKFVEDLEKETGIGMGDLSRLIDEFEQNPRIKRGNEIMRSLHSFIASENQRKSHDNEMKDMQSTFQFKRKKLILI
jgi:hypothetical protein